MIEVPESDRPLAERLGSPAPDSLVERRQNAQLSTDALDLMDGTPTLIVGDSDAALTIFYLHGGAFRAGGARESEPFLRELARETGSRIIAPDYRLAPEYPFPAALNDCLAAFAAFERGPGPVVLMGDSAGGGLVASMVLLLKRSVQAPDAAIMFSPWLDLRSISGSLIECAESDGLFSASAAVDAAQMYLKGHRADDPLASPLLGDWTGAPPIHIQVSATEILRDDTRALIVEARKRGVEVDAVEFADERHVWQLDFPRTVASRLAIRHVVAFLGRFVPLDAEADQV